nr:MAG TPA: hypothetical protein [Caudoviricetes sp.]
MLACPGWWAWRCPGCVTDVSAREPVCASTAYRCAAPPSICGGSHRRRDV